MHSGETFDEVIERNLRAAKAVIVIWSPRSVASRWVRAEATQADRANKLVPVKIEACDLPIIFELTHTADFEGWQGDRSDHNWASLVADLRRLVGPALPAAAEPTPPVEVATPVEAAPRDKAEPPVAVAESVNGGAQDELAAALERLAKKQGSALREPTEAEAAQANFFKRADAYRETESDLLHCLRRLHAPEGEALHVVGTEGLQIGRTAPSHVIVFEPGVSREHCLVELAAGKLRVMDLNSTNGTYINDKRIGRAEILPVGAVLRVGNISFAHEVHSRADLRHMNNVILYDLVDEPLRPRVA